MRKMIIEELHCCLCSLSEDERTLIQKLFFNGKTERKCAELLGISQTTLRFRKSKALAKLRKLIKS